MRKRKLKLLSPEEIERRQRQRDQAIVAQWVDMNEAICQTSLGKSTVAELIRQEKIRSSKIGKRRLINLPSLLALIDALAVGPAAPSGHDTPSSSTASTPAAGPERRRRGRPRKTQGGPELVTLSAT
jgi:hypothetical protein